MRILLRIVLCIIFSFVCLIAFVAWSGPHASAKNDLSKKAAAQLLVNNDLAAEYWKQLRHESTTINAINGLMFGSLLLGNAGIFMLTRKRLVLTPPPTPTSVNIHTPPPMP